MFAPEHCCHDPDRRRKLAGSLVGDLKTSVSKAMDAARQKIANATGELVTEITDGAANVERAARLALSVDQARRCFRENPKYTRLLASMT